MNKPKWLIGQGRPRVEGQEVFPTPIGEIEMKKRRGNTNE